MNKKVAIIIINYKDYAKRFLEECRDSIRNQNYAKESIQAFIVDNSSSKESGEYLNRKYPEAIILPRDDGNYAAANNLGIKRAIQDGFEYLVIANMDVKLDNNCIYELVKAIDKKSEAGIVQSKILLYPRETYEWENPKINSIGNEMNFLCFGFTKGYNQEDFAIEEDKEIKGYASGCCYITKKEVIEKIGGYNEEYFMYHDDIDIGWKVKLAGYKIYLAPKSVCFHKYEHGRSMRMLYYMERNRLLTFFIFYKKLTIILLLPALVFMDIGMLFYSIINKWFLRYLKIHLYLIYPKTWAKIIIERGKIKKIRNQKDKDIVKDFSGRVLFQEIDNFVLKYIANPIFNFYWKIAKKIIIW